MVCDNTILRSSGARGLDVSRCYRHIAPLERKAPMHQNSRCVMHRRGEVSSPAAGWGSQRLRVQWCATIPHCAPLERGGWTCRAAIDISLLWSERQNRIIVGARFPRLASQRLRVQVCEIPYCASGVRRRRVTCDISALWGFKPDGLGSPTGSMVCDNTTLRSSGALVGRVALL